MDLEVKHLAPYLPYKLQVKFIQVDDNIEGIGTMYRIETGLTTKQLFEINPTIIVGDSELYLLEDDIKPILRPLSDLTKEIEHNGEKFVPIDKISEDFDKFFGIHNERKLRHISDLRMIAKPESKTLEFYLIEWLPKWTLEKLFEWHFDVFLLNEAGLSIKK